jgi:hypothetical protein
LTIHADDRTRARRATLCRPAPTYYADGRPRSIAAPPKNEYWGGRTFGMTDPAGNTIFVVGPVT